MPTTGIFANDAHGLADAVGEGTVFSGGFDPGGAADFYARLLYAVQQGLNVDDAVRVELGLPSGIPARLQKLRVFIHNGCAAGESLRETCQTVRRHSHPHNPVNVP